MLLKKTLSSLSRLGYLMKIQKIFQSQLRSSLETSPKNLTISEEGATFILSAFSAKEKWRANNFSKKEPETLRWLKDEISKDSIFWDIGANIGLYSLYAASIQPNAKVLAFEPESQNFASLCRNIFINKFKNIEPFNIAINNAEPALVDLLISEMEPGSAIHNINNQSPWATEKPVFTQKTFAISIDSLVHSFKLPSPTILKIDVDGIENQICEGGLKALNSSVKTLLVEIDELSPNEKNQMLSIMESSGFRVFKTSDRSELINGKMPKNYIWKKK